MNKDIRSELTYQTARSGGAGGQHVNKVETMVIGVWALHASVLFSDEEKNILTQKLAGRISRDGFLKVRSQVHRTQLGNKEEVTRKMNQLINQALQPKKLRLATKPTKASKQKRIEAKKKLAEKKAGRKNPRFRDE